MAENGCHTEPIPVAQHFNCYLGTSVSGRRLTFAILALCLSLVCIALWQRSRDTARIREFWGAEGARLIQQAPRVALRQAQLSGGDDAPSLDDRRRWLDLSSAPGLVHLRATLVDDRYFDWPSRSATIDEVAASASEWRVLRFSSAAGFIDAAIDLEHGTVVNLVTSRAVNIIPASRQAIAAYLTIQAAP